MSSDSVPLPTLPLEVKGHILRFCDVETLGTTSQALLTMLELSGPLLYRDVTIRGKEQLEMMIRSETVLPSIAPFVSLAQTETFTFIPTSNYPDSSDVSAKLVNSPVSLSELILDLRGAPLDDGYVRLDVLLSSLDPQRIHVLGRPSSRKTFHAMIELPRGVAWPRLRDMTFTNTVSWVSLSQITSLTRRPILLDLALDLTSPSRVETGLSADLIEIRNQLEGWPMPLSTDPKFGRVQVWVNDARDVDEAGQRLIGCSCTSLDIGVKQHV